MNSKVKCFDGICLCLIALEIPLTCTNAGSMQQLHILGQWFPRREEKCISLDVLITRLIVWMYKDSDDEFQNVRQIEMN